MTDAHSLLTARPPDRASKSTKRRRAPNPASESGDDEDPSGSNEVEPANFLIGPEAVRAFIAREWKRRLDYRLKKEVWTYTGNQVSIVFEYEWHDADTDQWMLVRGDERWRIGRDGLVRRLSAHVKESPIGETGDWLLPKPVLHQATR